MSESTRATTNHVRTDASARVEGQRRADEQHQGERLADVLEGLRPPVDGHPVDDRRHGQRRGGRQAAPVTADGPVTTTAAAARASSHAAPASTRPRQRMTLAGMFMPSTPTTRPSRP